MALRFRHDLKCMQEQSWSTMVRPIPGTAPLAVSNGGSNHPVFESATVAEKKGRLPLGKIIMLCGIYSDHFRLRVWSVWMDSSWRISAMLTIRTFHDCRSDSYLSNLAANLLRQKARDKVSTTNN